MHILLSVQLEEFSQTAHPGHQHPNGDRDASPQKSPVPSSLFFTNSNHYLPTAWTSCVSHKNFSVIALCMSAKKKSPCNFF